MAGRPPKEKSFANMLRIAVNREGEDGKPKLRMLAEKLVECALNGESWAMQQVADRLDGKPMQQLDVEVTTRAASLMSDDELAAIASGGSEPASTAPVDPSRLN